MIHFIHNQTFRLLKELKPTTHYLPGIYRVILNAGGTIAAALIHPDEAPPPGSRGGRPRKEVSAHHRKKAPLPLVGKVLWLETEKLNALNEAMQLRPIVIERQGVDYTKKLTADGEAVYEARKRLMAQLLDQDLLRSELLLKGRLSCLFKQIAQQHGVTTTHVNKTWSLLCKHGFDERSLYPRFERCGAKGVARTCEPNGRKKPGPKTIGQKLAIAAGEEPPAVQPGVSSDWVARVMAADARIPCPKPRWPDYKSAIMDSQFVGEAVELDGKVTIKQPPLHSFPNDGQLRRILTVSKTALQRAREATTSHHFKRTMRGLVGRSWQGVAGPGHVWAIDSTTADIFLRSSVDRYWFIGRPVVYIIVDVWSTAIVGFHVCVSGPSWETAAVSLFNAASDPKLIGELWGYTCDMSLSPQPCMPYSIMFDRGEGLSEAERLFASKFIPHTQILPPYAGDLKGLVEVLHRIEKDSQFSFLPGAIDMRRKELELRKVDPSKCTMDLKDYAHHLYLVFSEYNFMRDRSYRLDPHMIAAGAVPTAAGLWSYGHEAGIGHSKWVSPSDLAMHLLPKEKAHVGRSSVGFLGCDYSSQEVNDAEWTTLARNFGGWGIPAHHHPASMSRIWTPNAAGDGALALNLIDESRCSRELSRYEYEDAMALNLLGAPLREYQNTVQSLNLYQRRVANREQAAKKTAEADAKGRGPRPTMTEGKAIEIAAMKAQQSETKVLQRMKEDAEDEYDQMMDSIMARRSPKDR